MTTSTHVYTAVLIGSPNVTLRVKGGTLTLDAGRAPHVQGSIEIAIPAQATLTALDPRVAARIQVTVLATFPSGSQSRTFNLGLRRRPVQHRDGTLTLDVASDEALLGDWAPLADDYTPLNYQSSLRALVNYVLGKVISGTTVSTSLSAPDVAVPALAASDNIIRNPRVAVDTVDWGITGSAAVNRETSGGPSGISATYYRAVPTAGATGVAIHIDEATVAVRPNTEYKLIAYVYAQSTQAVTLDGWLIDANGTVVGSATPVVATPGGSWVKLVCPFTTKETAASFRPRLSVNGAALALTVGLTAVRLSVDSGDPNDNGYFDGSTTSTTNYAYEWSNTAHASSSRREVLIPAATPEGLTWEAGQSALDFLRPIVQRFGLRLVCNEARVWTLRDETFVAAGTLTLRHGINLIDATETIDRDSGLWFDAQVTIYTWTDRSTGVQHRMVDSYALTGSPKRINTVEIASAYPGPGRSQYAVGRAQGRGRDVTATSVADWAAAAEMDATITLNGAPVQTGATQSVRFNLDRDEMTVNVRTIDTGARSIDLLTGTINGLTGTINAL